MTLRLRLLLVTSTIVAVGLLAADVAIYASLRSFLTNRTDQQLTDSVRPVSSCLAYKVGLVPTHFHSFPPGTPGRTSGDFPTTTTVPGDASSSKGSPTGSVVVSPCSLTPGKVATASDPFFTSRRFESSGFPPQGTFGELVGSDHKVKATWAYSPGKRPPSPVFPSHPPTSTAQLVDFTVGSSPAGLTYRAVAQPFTSRTLGLKDTVVVAVPLTDVTDTLGRLRLVEILVTMAVLVALAGLAWVVVRRELRPLDHMALTAGAIAAGDLTRRIDHVDERTEVGRLGSALNTMLEEIEGAFAARAASEGRLRRFLADASHELRTPLTSIRGYSELFDRGASDRPADLAVAIRHIREEATRMGVLVEDLLLLARLDHERPFERSPVDLAVVVDRAVSSAQVTSPDRTIDLDIPDSPIVSGDEDRLRQVVDNLLANATTHTPPGSPIRVSLRIDLTDSSRPTAVLAVADDGPGVEPEERSKIFEPFYRADLSRSRSSGGSGLGLAIATALVKAHGGEIGVDSPEGEGALFWGASPCGQSLSGR